MLRNVTKRVLPFGLAVVLCSATAVLAGRVIELTCTRDGCAYKGTVEVGGARAFQQITGYCVRDKQFVYLKWRRSEKPPPPIKVWNPRNGELMELYKCPKCGDLFLPIKRPDDLKYCPKCNHPTLTQLSGEYYD